MTKEKYFVDFYKCRGYDDLEVKVEALYDKNGEELYGGAKAILQTPWGIEKGKIVVSKFIGDRFTDYQYETIFTYAFKPTKGSQLYLDNENQICNDLELI